MEIKDTSLKGVKIIKMDSSFIDHRGTYKEIYNKKLYSALGDIEFIQDNISVSDKNVLRGIHGDLGTWKLVSCLQGKFYLVVVNCNREDPHFGGWQSFVLSADNDLQVLIPPMFGNGHLVLRDDTIFHYKQSTYYGDYKQFTVKWNESKLKIFWPIKNPILSLRDTVGPFEEF